MKKTLELLKEKHIKEKKEKLSNFLIKFQAESDESAFKNRVRLALEDHFWKIKDSLDFGSPPINSLYI